MSTTEKARLRPGVIVLLVIVTIANVAAVVLAIDAWSVETSHGGDLGGLLMLSLLVTVVALVGIVGAWLQKRWGPPLYFATQAMGFLFLLFAAPDAITLFTFAPLVLAGLLWFLAG